MALDLAPPGTTPASVQVVTLNGFKYEQRMNCCYNDRCSRCKGPSGWFPSHGPYWYLHVKTKEGKWLRLYIGKDMDLVKWMKEPGVLDWEEVLARPRARRASTPSGIPGGPDSA